MEYLVLLERTKAMKFFLRIFSDAVKSNYHLAEQKKRSVYCDIPPTSVRLKADSIYRQMPALILPNSAIFLPYRCMCLCPLSFLSPHIFRSLSGRAVFSSTKKKQKTNDNGNQQIQQQKCTTSTTNELAESLARPVVRLFNCSQSRSCNGSAYMSTSSSCVRFCSILY